MAGHCVHLFHLYKFSYHAMVVIYLYTVDFTCGASNGLYFGADHTLQSWHIGIPITEWIVNFDFASAQKSLKKKREKFHGCSKSFQAKNQNSNQWDMFPMIFCLELVEVIGEQASSCLSFRTPSVGNREAWDPACLTGLKRKASSCSRGARKLRA